MSKQGTIYTYEQMVTILKLLESNAFNYNKTAADTGVCRQAIHKWADRIGVQVFKHNAIQDIVFKADEKLMDKRVEFATKQLEFANKSFEVKELLLARIEIRAKLTNDLDALARTLKVINELDREVRSINPQDGGDSNTVNFIQIITDQLKLNNHEPKND